MFEERVQRRLAAILAADVVGYSRLMEQDEAGTLTALKARRREVLNPLVAQYRGRIVKVVGDGVLVEFASAIDAVECATELQKCFGEANEGLPDARRIVLRIGINLGDVIIEGSDLYGDGVNIAARLENAAEPGGILVSGTIFDHAKNKVTADFEELGARGLKNIVEPVRVYRVAGAPCTSIAAPKAVKDKPSIVVLPFLNISGDPSQDYFADGITEDVITQLSRFHSLLVISRPSSFTYKGRTLGAQAVGRELGVNYVVEGSVRKTGSRARVTAQLIDAESGSHVWAERYDLDLEEIFSVQDEITGSIVASVAGRLDDAGGERALRRQSEQPSLYDLMLQGRYFLNRGKKEDVLHARELFQRALGIDAKNARAHIGLAWTYLAEASSDWTEASRAAAKSAFDLARTAVELNKLDSEAHLLLAWAYFHVRSSFDLAASQVENAIKLNPNDYNNYCFKSWLLTCSGDPDSGIVCVNEALRRNPLVPNDCLYTNGVAEYLKGRYDRALDAFGQMSPSRHLDTCAYMAACYAELGRSDDARFVVEEFLERAASELTEFPLKDADTWRAYWTRRAPFKDQAQFEALLLSLQKAGLSPR